MRENALLVPEEGRAHTMHPVIGIPCQADYRVGSEQFLYRDKRAYVHAVESAGGLPTLIPIFTHPSELENLLSRVDGLLFPGGVDIQPGLYGEQPHPRLDSINPHLDAFEIALATWALQKDLPILGICRGMQLINVVQGGTLYQDLSAQRPGSLKHYRLDLARSALVHEVRVEKGSLMEQVLGTRQLPVNSLHHQAVKDPGKDLRICGWANDGVAELLEGIDHRFVLGVQCHPEELYQDVPAFAHLFQMFIAACIRSSTGPRTPLYSMQAFQRSQSASIRDLRSSPIPEEEFDSSKAA